MASRVTLDCPNNRYVNDEKICQALAAMWSQIGVATRINAMARANNVIPQRSTMGGDEVGVDTAVLLAIYSSV